MGRYPRKIRLIEPQWENGPRRRVPLPLAAERHGEARQTLESGPYVDYRRFLLVPIFGENSFYRESWGTKRGVAMLLNIVLTPGKPNPKSNFRDGS